MRGMQHSLLLVLMLSNRTGLGLSHGETYSLYLTTSSPARAPALALSWLSLKLLLPQIRVVWNWLSHSPSIMSCVSEFPELIMYCIEKKHLKCSAFQLPFMPSCFSVGGNGKEQQSIGLHCIIASHSVPSPFTLLK